MKALTVLKWAWPIEVALWLLFGFALVLWARAEQFARFMEMTPVVVTFVGGQGVIAFGGPVVKRQQEKQNVGSGGPGDETV